jgi:hypothetical protein
MAPEEADVNPVSAIPDAIRLLAGLDSAQPVV